MMLLNACKKIGISINHATRRGISLISHLEMSPVIVSSDRNIFSNLALEHWLYTNLKFDKGGRPVVLLWVDEPCVVIGRHQNPWIESTLGFINRAGIKLARRHSGGGCVYHDENNINISIIGDRTIFEKRQDNLQFVSKLLADRYGIECVPNKKHDLIHRHTGDKEVMSTAIRRDPQDFIFTNSTASTRSQVINLKDIRSDLTTDQVISDLTEAYGKLYGSPKDTKTTKSAIDEHELDNLIKIRQDLESWDWIYGMTPKFRLERSFNLIEAGVEKKIKIQISVNKGVLESVDVDGLVCGSSPRENFRYLVGTKFTYCDSVVNLSKLFDQTDVSHLGSTQVLATFMLQLIRDSNHLISH